MLFIVCNLLTHFVFITNCFFLFKICEAGNYSIHAALRDLRPPGEFVLLDNKYVVIPMVIWLYLNAGTKERRIPHPTSNPLCFLFSYVSCPNYTYEVTFGLLKILFGLWAIITSIPLLKIVFCFRACFGLLWLCVVLLLLLDCLHSYSCFIHLCIHWWSCHGIVCAVEKNFICYLAPLTDC